MIRLAGQWTPHLCALLLVTLVPVAMHGYAGVVAEDCARPTAIAPLWSVNEDSSNQEHYIAERLKPSQWREGILRTAGGHTLNYTIARGFDAKHIYYRPEYKLVRSGTPTGHEVAWIDAGSERIPVHRPVYTLEMRSRLLPFAAYLVLYDGRPVENPYRAQLLSAPRQILRGRVATTLLFVSGLALQSELPAVEARAYQWLRESWQNYQEICGSD